MSERPIRASELNKALGLGANDKFYRKKGTWYMLLRAFPGVLFDWTGYLLFQTEEEFKDSPYLKPKVIINPRYRDQPEHSQHKKIKIPGGISSVPGYVRFKNNKTAKEILDSHRLAQLGLS